MIELSEREQQLELALLIRLGSGMGLVFCNGCEAFHPHAIAALVREVAQLQGQVEKLLKVELERRGQ